MYNHTIDSKIKKPTEQKITLNLKTFTPTIKPPSLLPKIKPFATPKETIKPIPYKRMVAKKVNKKQSIFQEDNVTKNILIKKTTKILPKKMRKKKVLKKKKTYKKKRVRKKKKNIKKLKKRKKTSSKNKSLSKLLMSGASSYVSKNRYMYANAKRIERFYGKKFYTFSISQKKYIRDNLGKIHQITQRTLSRNGYPEVAIRTQQHGTQIVTFYLHPNGNISGLGLKKRIGYASLDKNTLEVIRIAYKDYPRPKTKTQITFYVEYNLF